MLNTVSVLIVVGLLLVVYLVIVTRSSKKFFLELFGLVVIVVGVLFLFYREGLTDLLKKDDLVEVQQVEEPSYNSFEEQAIAMDEEPDAEEDVVNGAPVVRITYPADGEVFSADTDEIVVEAEVTDDDPNPVVTGVGKFKLEDGYNPITVVVVDKDGNASSTFVVVKKEVK